MTSDSVITARWPAPKNIQAFSTVRFGMGVSRPPFDEFNLGNRFGDHGDTAQNVEINREQLRRQFCLPGHPHWLRQVHGIDVYRADSEPLRTGDFRNDEPVADASVTSHRDLVLAILTADCLPVLFCNDEGSEVAAAHAGWRGLAGGMLESTVRAMHSRPENILAWLGPAAGPQAYEIGIEVFEAFVSQDANAERAFSPTSPNHWLADLYQLARMRLNAIGVTAIYGGDHCTISEPDHFFSHRRDKQTGRMASIIWMAEP